MAKKRTQALKNYNKTEVFLLEKFLDCMHTAPVYNFDESIDLYLNLNLDTRHADQQLKGSVVLPHGRGKEVVLAVFAKGDKAIEAKQAGADIVGYEDLIDQVKNKNINFDKCIATPDLMGKIASIGRILGPKGLMPNPKFGTVTMDVSRTVSEIKKGRIDFKADKYGIVHASIARKSFDKLKVVDNIKAFIDSIKTAKPSGVKGIYMKSIFVSSTMGVSYKLNISEF